MRDTVPVEKTRVKTPGRLEKALSNEADVVYPPCANSLSVVRGIIRAWNLIRIPSRQYSRWCPETNSKYD